MLAALSLLLCSASCSDSTEKKDGDALGAIGDGGAGGGPRSSGLHGNRRGARGFFGTEGGPVPADVTEAMADIAAIFHWTPSEMDRMSPAEILIWRTCAAERTPKK